MITLTWFLLVYSWSGRMGGLVEPIWVRCLNGSPRVGQVSSCGTSLLVWEKSPREGHKNDHMTCFPDGGYFAGEWEEEGLP